MIICDPSILRFFTVEHYNQDSEAQIAYYKQLIADFKATADFSTEIARYPAVYKDYYNFGETIALLKPSIKNAKYAEVPFYAKFYETCGYNSQPERWLDQYVIYLPEVTFTF